MPFAFSTHACNDWSLEWQGVKNKRRETVLCFATGEGEAASWLCMCVTFKEHGGNFVLINLFLSEKYCEKAAA